MSIQALLRERQGYVQRNLPDRVAQVDACLAALGYVADDAPTAEVETAVDLTPVETAVEPRGGRKRSKGW